MPSIITGDDFNALFTTFDHTARRLEARGAYNVESEQASLERFLAGQEDDPEYQRSRSGWLTDVVGAGTDAGKRFARVRIVREPPTDYQRFGMRNARFNVEAGEDIRYLTRDQANALDLPAHDFWLFDEARLALLCFTADDRLLGAHVITDETVVRQHAEWLGLALKRAVPYTEYVSRALTLRAPPGMGV
jgi:hypothetical protein